MKKSAFISEDGLYRYFLERSWATPGDIKKTVLFVGLNPSTADATVDDPTIRRCIGFAKAWGFNRLWMVNLFAYRATNPAVMKNAANPEGEFNASIVHAASQVAELTVAAWGTHGSFADQENKYLYLLTNPRHLGLTKNGHPKHPLYLPLGVQPQSFYDKIGLVQGR